MRSADRDIHDIASWMLLAFVALWLIASAGVVPAVASRVQVGAETEVRSLRLEGVQSVSEMRIRRLLKTPTRGALWKVRTVLGKLPLVPSPSVPPFDPRVLQEDVVRIRNQYAAAGFIGTWVRYEVQADPDKDLIDITLIVDEGTPVRVVSVDVTTPRGLAPLAPEGEENSWAAVVRDARKLVGKRLDATVLLADREEMESWWRDRGYANATVKSYADRDSVRAEGRVHYVVEAGARRRFGEISVDGNHSISDHVVRRELPFQSGDLYSQRAVREAGGELRNLQIVRAARVQVPALESGDTTIAGQSPLAVDVKVLEAKPRVVSGEIGYVTDAGVSADASWSHRNFVGAGRVFTVSGLAQTPYLSLAESPEERYRATVSLLQPHLFQRRLSAIVSPFVEYRDDFSDRSLELGSNLTFIYRVHRLLSTSLDYRYGSRKIYEYRLGELVSGDIDVITFLTRVSQADSDERVRSSLFSLSLTAGNLDDLSNPRRGVLVKPAVQVTAPTSWSSANYSRFDGSVYAFYPLARKLTFAGRFTAGRLFPFGKSVPGPNDDPFSSALALRDVSFTGGGSTDQRGWSYRMLGPKFPDVRYVQVGDSIATTASGYVPLGGFSRVSFSAEVRMPLPPLGRTFGSHIFLDGARVWTSDDRFTDGEDPFDEQRMFYATGAGIDLFTPVGAIKLSLGYKLNPSIQDLVDARELWQALLAGTSTDDLKRHEMRRWHLNLAIGTSF